MHTDINVYRARYAFGAAILAGLVAGLIFIILEMILTPLLLGGSLWRPIRMIAAIAMGERVLQALSILSMA